MVDLSKDASLSDVDSSSETQFPTSSKLDSNLAPRSSVLDVLCSKDAEKLVPLSRKPSNYPRDSVFKLIGINQVCLALETSDGKTHLENVYHVKEQNMLLYLENEILEKYLMKVNPALIQGMDKLLDKVNEITTKSQLISQSLEPVSRAGSRLSQISKPESYHSAGRASSVSPSGIMPLSEIIKPPHINYDFRHDIVNREMNYLRSKLEKRMVRMKGEKIQIAAGMVELAMRITDLEEFKRKLLLLTIWGSTKINLEMFLSYTMNVLKQITKSIDQSKTKMTILNIEKKKLLLRIEDKERLSSSIYPIDFNILEIQNQELREEFSRKCQDLVIAKRSLECTEKSLQAQTSKIKSLKCDIKSLCKKIKSNQMKLVNIKRKQKMLDGEVKEALKGTLNRKKLKSINLPKNIEALDVMSYAFTKLCLTDLNRKLKISSMRRQRKLALLNSVRHHLKLLANRSTLGLDRPCFF